MIGMMKKAVLSDNQKEQMVGSGARGALAGGAAGAAIGGHYSDKPLLGTALGATAVGVPSALQGLSRGMRADDNEIDSEEDHHDKSKKMQERSNMPISEREYRENARMYDELTKEGADEKTRAERKEEEKRDRVNDAVTGGIALGGGVAMLGADATKDRLTGQKTLYHGTPRDDWAESIKNEGLNPGAAGKNIQSTKDSFTFAGNNAGFVTQYRDNRKHPPDEGEILDLKMPYQDYDEKFEMDPKHPLHAVRSTDHIGPEYFTDSDQFQGNQVDWGEYAKDNPLRLGAGAAGLALGGAGVAYGGKKLKDAITGKQDPAGDDDSPNKLDPKASEPSTKQDPAGDDDSPNKLDGSSDEPTAISNEPTQTSQDRKYSVLSGEKI